MPSQDLAEHDQSVHIDTWTYTRDGLRVEPIAVRPGARNRITLLRPAVVPAVAASHGGFASGISFPLPALLSLLLFRHRGNQGDALVGVQPRAGVVQVFAHVGASEGEAKDKDLADRRARVVGAMLEGDVDTVLEISAQESWGVDVQQVMLRTLLADPGPIDGIVGPLTTAAIVAFQARYVSGEFHRRSGATPRDPNLDATGCLDPGTVTALVESFVQFHAVGLEPSSWHPTHPRNGCGAFNPIASEGDLLNDRVSLVVHRELPQHHETTPCKEGDASACPILGDHEQRCSWFRAHVKDARFPEVVHHHFRLAWLPLPNGRVLLSALTTIPDLEDVEIEVMSATQPVDGETLADPSVVVGPIAPDRDVLKTKPILGVAQVVWDPPPGFSPDFDGRFMDPQGNRLVPIFRVHHPGTGTVAFDSWPADEVAVLFDRSLIDADLAASEQTELELVCAAQGLRIVRPSADAVPYDDAHYALRFEGIRPEGLFSLVMRYRGVATRTIFEDVRYEALEDHGPPSRPPPGPLPPGMDAAEPPGGDALEEASLDYTDDPDFPLLGFDAAREDRGPV